MWIARQKIIPGFFEKGFQLIHIQRLIRDELRLPEREKAVKQAVLPKNEKAGKSNLSSFVC
jgi:hypothetical protein